MEAYILKYNNDVLTTKEVVLQRMHNGLVKVIAEIKKNSTYGNQIIFGVNWLVKPTDIEEEDELTFLVSGVHNSIKADLIMTENMITTLNNTESKTLMKAASKNQRVVSIVSEENFDEYETAKKCGEVLRKLYSKFPVYKNIILFDNEKPTVNDIVDVLYTLDDRQKEDFITSISYSNGYMYTVRLLCDRILDASNIQHGQDLMTQEQQVESFINFSKLVADEKTEIVSDELLESIKESDEYQEIKQKLESKGFGLSKTQQFNVLQSAAYFSKSNKRYNGKKLDKVIYNLSDMGAGKTLMTVESIALMDLNLARTLNEKLENNDLDVNRIERYKLPDKNLIAPKLSIESSWVDTFKLFYDVVKVNDHQYQLTMEYDGKTYESMLHVTAFTARTNAITVENKLPKSKRQQYLIIDEIHQLVKRKITRSRFFEESKNPSAEFMSFILSGTLSNLTTNEWFNYIQFMGIQFADDDLNETSATLMKQSVENEELNLTKSIQKGAENITIEQKRYFDPTAFEQEQTAINEDKQSTNKMALFNLKYASKVIKLPENVAEQNLQSVLMGNDFELVSDSNIIETPNFELFYSIVGHSAITAQSTQIAEELFGKQQKQHNAEVINTKSPLTAEDIEILRTLHDITKDYNIYKSQAIATAINNAILNLNDGLATKNIYDIVSKYAQSNIRFLQYLATLDVNVLEKLPESGLINLPDIKETNKFAILEDILRKESEETHLIVVNDIQAVIKLSKALDIEHMTRKEMTNQLDYQETLDNMFEKQNIVVVPQMMIKSSLDLVQANRLIQYQLNTEISDIIQTQNRINRIGQTRETKAYYIATDALQKNIIDLFLETYKNIRVAHKGIVELFVDMSTQVNVINDYISKAMMGLDSEDAVETSDDDLLSDDNGNILLFDLSEYEESDVAEQPEELVESRTDAAVNGQMNLFNPLEMGAMSQLVASGE